MIVLHYIPSIDRSSGGVGAYMQLLAKSLGELCELHVATHREDNPLEIENAMLHYISPSIFGGMKCEWTTLLDELKPDVVHVNTCWLPMSAIAQKVAQKRGIKVVLSPHGMLEPWILHRHYWTKKVPAMLLYQKSAVRNADLLHATAETERSNLFSLGWNNQVVVIPNGVDVGSIEMKTLWERKKKILFLSRVHIKKGVNFLIEAVSVLRDELRGYEVIIAGEGEADYIAELKRMAVSSHVEHIVRFAGGVYGEEKWQLMRDADLFVLPTHSENFGIVVAEALASGTPVITTVGTPWRELDEFHCGWQAEIGTKPLVAALKDFLHKSPDELSVMGANGRKLVEEKYSTACIARMMMLLYETM